MFRDDCNDLIWAFIRFIVITNSVVCWLPYQFNNDLQETAFIFGADMKKSMVITITFQLLWPWSISCPYLLLLSEIIIINNIRYRRILIHPLSKHQKYSYRLTVGKISLKQRRNKDITSTNYPLQTLWTVQFCQSRSSTNCRCVLDLSRWHFTNVQNYCS